MSSCLNFLPPAYIKEYEKGMQQCMLTGGIYLRATGVSPFKTGIILSSICPVLECERILEKTTREVQIKKVERLEEKVNIAQKKIL